MNHCTLFFDILHSLIYPPALLTQIHDRTDKLGSHHNLCFHHRLFHIFDLCRIRHIGWIGQVDHFSVCLMDFIDNTWRSCHKIQIILSLQTLLHDLQMQKPKESTAESKPKSHRCLRFKLQRRIIELQFFQRISQIRIFCSICRIQSTIHHWIYLFIPRKRFCTRPRRICDRITDTGVLYIFQTGCDISNHSRAQLITRNKLSGSKISNLDNIRLCSCCHHPDRCSFFHTSLFDPAEYDDTFVSIINRIEDQCF